MRTRHSLTTLPFALPSDAGRVAEVDDELGALDEVGVVDRRVVGDDDDAVGARDRRRQRHRLEAELAQLRHVRVVVADVAALGLRSSSISLSAGDSRVSSMSGL